MLISNKEHLSSLLQNAESFKNVAHSTRAGALASTVIESVDIRNRLKPLLNVIKTHFSYNFKDVKVILKL